MTLGRCVVYLAVGAHLWSCGWVGNNDGPPADRRTVGGDTSIPRDGSENAQDAGLPDSNGTDGSVGGGDSSARDVAGNTDVSDTPVPVSLIIPIARGNDDAEELTQRGQNGIEVYESGYTYHDSTDLELTYDGWFSAHQMVGLRFVGVAIPRHAHITDAFIHFTVRDGDSASVNLTVSGEASGNALGFSMTRYNLSSRSRTGATVSWRGLAAWSDGERRNSPQLSTIIQEIINQASWASGNALVILIEGTGDDRAAYSYDGRQAAAPRLHVTYE